MIKNKNSDGVHASHCCKCHCKYGDKDCPVVLGRILQKRDCDCCGRKVIKKNMTIKERYFECKRMCEKINCLLDQKQVIQDHENTILSGKYRFNFVDDNNEISLRYSQGGILMFCGKDQWGNPNISIFKKFKTLGKPVKIFK